MTRARAQNLLALLMLALVIGLHLVTVSATIAFLRPDLAERGLLAPLLNTQLALALATAPLLLLPILLDGLIALQLGLLVFAWQRRPGLALLVALAWPGLLLAASVGKYAVLGAPAEAADVFLLRDLARAAAAWQVALAVALLAGLSLATLANLRWPRRREMLTCAPIAVALLALGVASLHAPFAASLSRSLPLRTTEQPLSGHFASAYAEVARALDAAHHRDDAAPLAPALAVALQPRPVHILVLESFVDPLAFSRYRMEPEPLSPIWAKWRRGAGGHAVVPVFGNRSSNTEFEILCGVPAVVGPAGVVFREIPPERELDCLPRRLRQAGFVTVATAPNGADFFRAGQAYRAMGFEQRRFDRQLDMSDMDGGWLSAEATLRQSAEHARGLMGQAFLNYTFVNAAHFPFERNRDRRPDAISVSPATQPFQDWVNAIHHTALASERYVREALRAHPDALILLLGDHQPPLASLPDAPAGLEGAQGGLARYLTPLLILDRGRMHAVGALPAWLIPELVLDLLSAGEHCRVNACRLPAAQRLRPFRDQLFILGREPATVTQCQRRGPAADPVCDAAQREATTLAQGLEAMLRPHR
jgi:hypothetical protein